MSVQESMTEDRTVVSRLQRLQRIADMSLENIEDGDTAHDEMVMGLDNIIAELKEANTDDQDLDEYEQLEYDVNRCEDCDENHLCSDHAARRRDL